MGEPMDTSSTSSEKYFLSRIVEGHKGDVKSVDVSVSGLLISGSRDETVRMFMKKAGSFTETAMYQQPKGLTVNSIAFYEGEDGWRLFVGRKNGSIAIYASGSTEPIGVLQQHKGNVSCLHVDKKNAVLLSGCWEHRVIVWSIPMLTDPSYQGLQLDGHTMSVWALAALPESPQYYLSGGADKNILLWNNDKIYKKFQGHTDVVRALLLLDEHTFASTGNDLTVRIWNIEAGTCLVTLPSLSDDLIFGLAKAGNYVLSCGDNGHMELWSKTEEQGHVSLKHEQVINVPAGTAWSASSFSNGDFAVGASNGRIYIFTTDESRKAPAEIAGIYDQELAERVAKEAERQEKDICDVVTIKVALDDGAPQLELKYKKGTDPVLAAEKFISDNGLPISYLNEITDYIVANIPEARAAVAKKNRPQPTQRCTIDGETYDYSLEITLDQGNVVKLGYNADDDPDYVAQRFCEKHNLSMQFLTKIAQILRQELRGVGAPAATGSAGAYHDPFTGGGRHVPGGGESSMDTSSYADPLTGGGRYVPGSQGAGGSAGGGDPLTSEGRYIPNASAGNIVPIASMPQDKKKPRGELVPLSEYYLFGVEQLSQKAIAKLKDTNASEHVQLNDEQLAAVEQLMSNPPGSFQVSDVHVSAIDLGLQWDIKNLGPILDAFRIALLHEELNKYYCSEKGVTTLERIIAILISEPPLAVRVFVCRSIANAFSHQYGRNLLISDLSQLVTLLMTQFSQSSGPLQLAAASALANMSYLLFRRSAEVSELGPREDVLRGCIKVLEGIPSFGDYNQMALVRLLQALVTLMWGDTQIITLAKSRNIVQIINRLKDAVVEDSGKNVARDIVEMTYAV